jgi:hypothetical protein
MININFSLTNPWIDRFDHVTAWSKKLSKHKACELEVYRSETIMELEFRLSVRQDHAGITLGIGLFTWTVRFQIYDNRHWDYEKGQWYDYN